MTKNDTTSPYLRGRSSVSENTHAEPNDNGTKRKADAGSFRTKLIREASGNLPEIGLDVEARWRHYDGDQVQVQPAPPSRCFAPSQCFDIGTVKLLSIVEAAGKRTAIHWVWSWYGPAGIYARFSSTVLVDFEVYPSNKRS